MYSRDTTYPSAEAADFSSVFMRTSTADQNMAMDMLDDDIDEQVISGNRNLSSIITQIRDEGAALPKQKKKAVRRHVNNSRALSDKSPGKTAYLHTPARSRPPESRVDSIRSAYQSPGETTMPDIDDSVVTSPAKKHGTWQPFILSLSIAVAAVMGFNLYQLNDETIEMRAVLDAYEEQIDELSSSQRKSTAALLKVSSMKKELSGLEQELKTIKSDYSQFDNKLAQTDATKSEPHQTEIATVKQEVSELETDLASTRSEMTAMKTVIEQVKDELATKQVPDQFATAQSSTVQSSTVQSDGGWVVNLASLSTREQAQIGLKKLKNSGVQSDIQETIVNGATVYRLSVAGFASRNAAMQFINKAKSQYGFSGGWVWQS